MPLTCAHADQVSMRAPQSWNVLTLVAYMAVYVACAAVQPFQKALCRASLLASAAKNGTLKAKPGQATALTHSQYVVLAAGGVGG